MEIGSQLKLIEKSYDHAIDLGRRGIDLYKDLPEHILSDPAYPLFQKMITEEGDSSSGRKVKDDAKSNAFGGADYSFRKRY